MTLKRILITLYNTKAMKLDFSCPPLDIYNQEKAQSLLQDINRELPDVQGPVTLDESIVSSLITRATGIGAATFIDGISNSIKSKKAKNCMADLIVKQRDRIISNPSSILQESQINLMATQCIIDHLSNLESNSISHTTQNLGKVAVGLLKFKNPLKVLFESAEEQLRRYYGICQIYHIAFLLTVYISLPKSEIIIKQLIIESISKDSEGDDSFGDKLRPLLFSDSPYQSLERNLTHRLDILFEYTRQFGDIYDEFIMSRQKFNASLEAESQEWTKLL